jgi:sulfate transport system ATP-binding protein
MGIEVQNISKYFGRFQVLKEVNLSVRDGELLALLGPSGSGKTTLLRIVAGLDFPDAGSILLNGEDATVRSAQQRRVGFVFQHYALFRHMTVFENVAFGLRVRSRQTRPSKAAIREKVMTLLKLVQLEPLAHRYPAQLSGGQRQRIALARALAVEPKVLLLDEPFGALDARVRKELRMWLRRLHDEIHVACVFVTHDQEEALEVSDRVAIMDGGRIEQVGTPEDVYEHPANPFVYSFLGNVNLFHGRLDSGRPHIGSGHGNTAGGDVIGYARPHEMEISRDSDDADFIEASIVYIQAVGPNVRIQLKRADNAQALEAELNRDQYRELNLKVGESVFVKPKQVRVFSPSSSPVNYQI